MYLVGRPKIENRNSGKVALATVCTRRAMDAILRFARALGALPPHEFAYGTQLKDITDLPQRVRQILSLEIFDPQKMNIQVSGTKGGSDVRDLAKYCSEPQRHTTGLEPLPGLPKEIQKIQPELERAIGLIERLVEYRDALRDETRQDEVIVFIHYGLKNPQSLPQDVRDAIGSYVAQFDTPRESQKFAGRHCPANFLAGNINIYPRLIENTSWYGSMGAGEDGQTPPILEIRFMGLRGIFKYILQETQNLLACEFCYLDGDLLDPGIQERT